MAHNTEANLADSNHISTEAVDQERPLMAVILNDKVVAVVSAGATAGGGAIAFEGATRFGQVYADRQAQIEKICQERYQVVDCNSTNPALYLQVQGATKFDNSPAVEALVMFGLGAAVFSLGVAGLVRTVTRYRNRLVRAAS